MRNVFILIALIVITSPAMATRGYLKSNGTYVQPSIRTAPNHTKLDNYSTRGNYNPYTGKRGTVNPYKY